MKSNVGKIDRTSRVIIGVGIISAGLYFKSWWGLVGIVPLLTATFSFCPAYTLLGLDTCGMKR